MHIPQLFYRHSTATRGKKLKAWWPDCSHDMGCSILSSADCGSTIPRTGFRRRGETLILTIISIFVDIKITAAFSSHKCKQRDATDPCWHLPLWEYCTLCQHEELKRRRTFFSKKMEWCLTVGNWKQLFCSFPVCPFWSLSNLKRTKS